jgi:hypothetical protein
MTAKTMTADELNTELSAAFRELKAKRIKPAQALEMTRLAFCIQSNVRLQLFNARMRNETPTLAFFGQTKKPTRARR